MSISDPLLKAIIRKSEDFGLQLTPPNPCYHAKRTPRQIPRWNTSWPKPNSRRCPIGQFGGGLAVEPKSDIMSSSCSMLCTQSVEPCRRLPSQVDHISTPNTLNSQCWFDAASRYDMDAISILPGFSSNLPSGIETPFASCQTTSGSEESDDEQTF